MAIIFSRAKRGTTIPDLLRRGRRLLRTGDIVAAELCFRRAVALDTGSAEAWWALASTQLGARHAICVRWAEATTVRMPAPQPIAKRGSRLRRIALSGILGASGVAGMLVVGTDLAYGRHVLPNVSIAGVSVANLPLDRLDEAVAARQDEIARRAVRLSAAGHEIRLPLGSLLHDNGGLLLREAAAYGHGDNMLDRAAVRARAFWGDQLQIGRPELDAGAIQRAVDAIANAVERPAVDATLARHEGIWRIAAEHNGRALDRVAAAQALRRLIEQHAWSTQTGELAINFQISTLRPDVAAAQLVPIRERLRELAARPLHIAAAGQAWMLDPSTLVRFDTTGGAQSVQPDTAAIDAQLDAAADALLIPPQPSRLEREGQRVRSLVAGVHGRELHRQAAATLISDAIMAGTTQLELPLRELAPPPGEIEQLGLLAELGRGQSQFVSYSSPNRDANVLVGGRDIDGVLLAPGEVFSFNDTVGWIGEAKGYRWGEAIENGVVVPSIGGGICQVSTTIFRAAFWSGLPIVERHNHMWRLPWYEADAPAGMDATIAIGGPDFRFRNDTQHHILINVETDLATKRQTVILLGTPDGRRVEMQPISNGNTGVYRSVVGTHGILADEAFVSYYTQ